MAIILVLNEKGGVGKTTTAVNLAAGLAMRGREELIVDLDTQGNVSSSLGIEKKSVLFEWLVGDAPMKDLAFNARPHLDVMRSDRTTSMLKTVMAGMSFRELVLAKHLKGYEQFWDDVVLDCSPSFDLLHAAAMIAADLLIIPTAMDQFSVDGVMEVISSLHDIKEVTDSKCMLAGVIPIRYENRTRESHAQLKALAKACRGWVWPVVPQDTRVREAAREGKTLWEYPRGKALEGYEACLEKLLELI